MKDILLNHTLSYKRTKENEQKSLFEDVFVEDSSSELNCYALVPSKEDPSIIVPICSFCKQPETEKTGPFISKQHPLLYRNKYHYIHYKCAMHSPNVSRSYNKWYNIMKEWNQSKNTICSVCGEKGANIHCIEEKCTKYRIRIELNVSRAYHYSCYQVLSSLYSPYDIPICPIHKPLIDKSAALLYVCTMLEE